jgi:hypothetical protein
MGVGGAGESYQKPREISIGFRKPRSLDRDTIYVQISPRDEIFTAEAVSNFSFNSRYKSIFGHYVNTRVTKARSRDYGDGISFIEMLVHDNNGNKGCRLIIDSYFIWDEIKQSPRL